MVRNVCLAVVLLAGAGAAVAQDPPSRSPTAAWSAADCAAVGLTVEDPRGVECGFVTVPLRHGASDGPTIELAVAVLAATGERRDDPLFIAQGGPGGATIASFGDLLLADPTLRPTIDRDLVLWDQRGSGQSRPALTCPETTEELVEAAEQGLRNDSVVGLEAAKACGARLAAEADLSAFNSAENADDVETLRVALGYESFNFYGVSYGTELGQFVMRRHPEHLRSAVLDAVVPLDYNLFTEPAFAQQRIAEKYFDACAAQPACDAAYPDLADRYLALIDRLNADPVPLTVTPLDAMEPRQILLTGDLLEEAIYGSLYMNVQEVLPLIIDRADKGDFTIASAFLLPMTLFDTSVAEGMYMAVSCADRGDTDLASVAFPDVLPRLATSTRTEAETALEICRDWGIDLLPRSDFTPVASAVPTLLLSGDYDPITPPEYAARLMPHLARGQHVVFPGGSHGQAMTGACANGIIAAFLDDPDAPVDTTCVGGATPEFKTPGDVIFLETAQGMLSNAGIVGLLFIGLLWAPAILGGLLLLTAAFVYPVGYLVRLVRGRVAASEPGEGLALSRAAPWLAVAAGMLSLGFVGGLAYAYGSTFATNETLAAMGAISSGWRWLLWLPPILGGVAAVMVAATVSLWRSGRRSTLGRVYFTLLTIAAVAAAINLWLVGG